MEKLNYSDLLQPAIDEIRKDIETDNRGFDEPSNALLILASQISTEEDGEDVTKYVMMGNGLMLATLVMKQMIDNENFALIIQAAADAYRDKKKDEEIQG